MSEPKVYLGDGAYARFDGFAVWVTTEDGISVQNEVCLEPETFAALATFCREHGLHP